MPGIPSQIDRINSAKADIAAAIEEQGVTVPSGTMLDGMATLIRKIAPVIDDRVIYTMLDIDIETGALLWSHFDPYTEGSVLSLSDDGGLIQTAAGNFNIAVMSLDAETGIVSASV
jgi:hypothetical protein|nr:MAG TPA: protein of unknown function (DUF4905) [Caudoviricetes sp.]